MSVRVVLPSVLRAAAGGDRELSVDGGTVRDVFDDLARRLPVLERRLRDESGALRPHVLVFLDGVMLREPDALDRRVDDGAELFIAPAVSGG